MERMDECDATNPFFSLWIAQAVSPCICVSKYLRISHANSLHFWWSKQVTQLFQSVNKQRKFHYCRLWNRVCECSLRSQNVVRMCDIHLWVFTGILKSLVNLLLAFISCHFSALTLVKDLASLFSSRFDESARSILFILLLSVCFERVKWSFFAFSVGVMLPHPFSF